MAKNNRMAFSIILFLIISVAIWYFMLPFGLFPKLSSPNCGPEEWRFLGKQFSSKSDVVAYLQDHEMQILSSTMTPRLSDFPPNAKYSRMELDINWQVVLDQLEVVERLGYTVYTYTYHHPACGESQTFTLKVTSYGFASLYGCCGV